MSTTRASLSSGEVTRNQLSAWVSREAITRVKQRWGAFTFDNTKFSLIHKFTQIAPSDWWCTPWRIMTIEVGESPKISFRRAMADEPQLLRSGPSK
jgi:hypothetical protein